MKGCGQTNAVSPNGGFGGFVVAAVFGFAASFTGSVVQQAVSGDGIRLSKAFLSGGIGSAASILTFGATSIAMRGAVGVFDDILDTSLKFGTRLGNALSFSAPSLIFTLMFNLPVVVAQTIVESIIGYWSNKSKNINVSLRGSI